MRLTLFKGCRQLTRSASCPEKHLLVGRIDSIGEPPPTPTRDQPAAEPRRGAAIYPGVVAWAMVARREGGFAAAVAACRSERRRREFAARGDPAPPAHPRLAEADDQAIVLYSSKVNNRLSASLPARPSAETDQIKQHAGECQLHSCGFGTRGTPLRARAQLYGSTILTS
jgi:hypothetical protein